MITHNESRRSFLFTSLGLAAAGATSPRSITSREQTLTAGQVIDRIKANVGIPWQKQTVDNIIAGTAETPVKGIATTMMATLDVIQRAAASGQNMVITHEPTFYSHQDQTEQLAQDPVYKFKLDFINKNNMVVFHFHDHWHRRNPDGINAGMAQELGWEKNADPENPRIYTFPATPLAKFAKDIEARLKIRTMRVLGDPKLPVKRVIASWGYVSQTPAIPYLARPDIDALVVGETREWEVVEYAQDAIASGQKKALIALGHVVSEQAGMKLCAEWLREFIKEVPIELIAAAEPFWSPGNSGQ
jgi:putative NIF3 family GTP cyclohydrolase 1 type 2